MARDLAPEVERLLQFRDPNIQKKAGNYVKDEVWHALIVVITNASNMRGYAVRSLYRALRTAGVQETLVQLNIGEYGEILVCNGEMLDIEEPLTVTELDAVDVVETSVKSHSSDHSTCAMCLIALLKLSSRFPYCSQRINDIIGEYKGSFVLELQQRAIEFNSIIERHRNMRSARMPVLDEATYIGRRAGSMPAAVSTYQIRMRPKRVAPMFCWIFCQFELLLFKAANIHLRCYPPVQTIKIHWIY